MKYWRLIATAGALFPAAIVTAQGPEFSAPMTFDHFMVAISVSDMEKETDWYVDNLGFSVEKDAEMRDGAVHFRWLTNGSERIELVRIADSKPAPARPTPPGHAAVQGLAHFTLETQDLEAVRDALVTKGITPTVDITEVAPLGIRVIYLLDPEGNAVEIAQRTDG